VILVGLMLAAAVGLYVVSRVWRSQPGTRGGRVRAIATVLALAVGLYFIGRAVAEPFLVDFGNPATYHNDWGGPSLAGVLAVHCGPGILALAAMLGALRRRQR
jgi:hypothetical protein